MNGWKYLASQNDSFTHGKVYTDVKWLSQHLYDLRFSRHYVVVRVGYLSSSEAYTNNWGLFGKEHYLAFDRWKQFLLILRRSEDTIYLTRPHKKCKQVSSPPCGLLYYIYSFFFRTHLAPVLWCSFVHSSKWRCTLGTWWKWNGNEQRI